MTRVLSSIVALSFLTIPLIAQDNVEINISGKVTDKVTQKAVPGATVKLEKMNLSATTGVDGSFTITGTPVGVSQHYKELSNGFSASISNSFLAINVPEKSDVIITAYSLQGKVLSKMTKNFGSGTHQIAALPSNTGVCLYKIELGSSEIVLKSFLIDNNERQGVAAVSAAKALNKQALSSATLTDKLIVTASGYVESSFAIDNPVKSGINAEIFMDYTNADPFKLVASFLNLGNANAQKYVDKDIGPATIGLGGNGGTRTIKGAIVVPPGVTYDGKGETLNADKSMGDGSQNEGQAPYFLLCPWGNVKNVTIGSPGCEGIHMMGYNKVEHILWTNVGEDAASVRSYMPGGIIYMDDVKASSAADKLFQVNAECLVIIKNATASGIGKFIRQGGSAAMDLVLENVKCSGVREAVIMANNSNCRYMVKNVTGGNKGGAKIDWVEGASEWDGVTRWDGPKSKWPK